MSIEEIHVKRLQLKVPRSLVRGGRTDGERLAGAVAAQLAESIRRSVPATGDLSMKSLQVRVARGQATAEGISHAIQRSIGEQLATPRKGR